MAHRAVGIWKVYSINRETKGNIGLKAEALERSRVLIKMTRDPKKTRNPPKWTLNKIKNVAWKEKEIELVPDNDTEPTNFRGKVPVTIEGVEHDVTLALDFSEDDVLDDELHIAIKKSSNAAEAPIAQGTANSGRG